MNIDTLRELREIADRDPDAGPTRPTPAAYAAHRVWAVRAYGPMVWAAYRRGGWERPAEV